MSAVQLKSRRDEVAEHVLGLVKSRAKRKGNRVKKLEDQGARDGVVNGAAWRLILNQQRFGNVREFIEGNFWYEDGDARNKLIDRALDAERQAHIRTSKASGGSELTDAAAFEDLARYADAACNPFEPQLLPHDTTLQKLEQGEQLEAEAAAFDAREKIEAEENARLRQAVAVYEKKLRRKHRDALSLVCGPRLPNGVIALRCGVAERTVAKIRADVCDMADEIFTLPPEEVYLAELERLADIAEAEAKARRVEARRARAQWALRLSAKELAEFKAFAGPLCEVLGWGVDDLLGASIVPREIDQ